MRVTRMDRIRNEYISRTVQVKQFAYKVREARQQQKRICQSSFMD